MFIDSDTHVDECADTWAYIPNNFEYLRPAEMAYLEHQIPPFLKDQPTNGWFIDGQIYPKRIRNDGITGTTSGTRELRDIPTRLRHMDALNVDVQVIYPTLLLHEFTRRPEVEITLCASYNRWIADRTAEGGERLRWVAVLPLRSMPEALKEMRAAKSAGAIGIYKRPFECDERRAGDSYFSPLYELAQDLELPICFHVGRPYTGNMGEWSPTQHGIHISSFTHDAFLSLLQNGVPDRFPKLRFGFIEAGAAWLPYSLWVATKGATTEAHRLRGEDLSRKRYVEILQQSRFFVTCELSENLPALIDQVGDDSLCVGTDYVHNDPHFDLSAFKALFEFDGLSTISAEKIAGLNAQRFYGIATEPRKRQPGS